MRGGETTWDATVGADGRATASRPRSLTARCALAPSTMNVPAGYAWPFDVNVDSATETFEPFSFHGSAADRQSPRWRTSSTLPEPFVLPVTFASAASAVIGFARIVESTT